MYQDPSAQGEIIYLNWRISAILLPEKVVTPSTKAHEIFVEGAATEELDAAEHFAALGWLAARVGDRQRQHVQQHQTRLHLQYKISRHQMKCTIDFF
jgi:hypothetical protein